MTHHHRSPRAGRVAAGMAALALALVACTGGGSSSKQQADDTPTPTPPPPPKAPLTGVVVADESIVERPVLAVKIENSTAARPQAGLERADIVYEELVEGGITRFVALYHSKDASQLGPIRSARMVDPDILAEYGTALFAFSGAAARVKRFVYQSDLVPLEHGPIGAPAYKRVSFRRAPHNLYSSTEALRQAAEGKGTAPEPRWTFGPVPPPPAPDATPTASATATPEPPTHLSGASVRVPFSTGAYTAVWEWDPTVNRYVRSHGSTPHTTADGDRITAKNVLVLTVEVRQGGHRDSAGNRSPEITLEGSGTAVLLRDGVRIEGTWRRDSLQSGTVFTDSEGREMVFAAGPTWIELAPKNVRVTYS